MKRAAAYSLIVAAPMALWALRNVLATEEFRPHSPPTGYPVAMMLLDVVRILWKWALTNAAAVLAPCVCILIVVQWRRLTVADRRPIWLFGGFALMYLFAFISTISLLVGIYLENGVSERLLIPAYIPILLAGVFALDRTMWSGREGSMQAAIVASILALGLASQIAANVFTIARANSSDPSSQLGSSIGPRYNGSETLRYVRRNLAAARMYSNAPQLLSLHVDGSRKYAPYRHLPAFHANPERLCIQDGAYVVWLHSQESNDQDHSDADLRALPCVEPVVELADGVVFKVSRDDVPERNP